MKRAPQKPKLEKLRLLCTSINSTCSTCNSDIGNRCISKFRKREEGDDRHPMHLGNDPSLARHDWVGGRCTCPLCISSCNKLFHMKDFPKIGLAVLQASRRQQAEPDPEVEVSEMLGRSLSAGLLAVSHTQSVRTGNHSGARAASGVFYDAASSLMTRVGGDMSSGTIQNTQRIFGRGTNLTLPNGGKFDTNHIALIS